jgi:hypothetical protein
MCELNDLCTCRSQVPLCHAQVMKGIKFCESCDINRVTIILGIVVFFYL